MCMFFYSKTCYVLSQKQSEELDDLLVSVALKLFAFCCIYVILFADVVGRALSDAIVTFAIVLFSIFYFWKVSRIIKGSVKVVLNEFASAVYPKFIAKHSQKR